MSRTIRFPPYISSFLVLCFCFVYLWNFLQIYLRTGFRVYSIEKSTYM